MNSLRLDYFLKRGGSLIVGDEVTDEKGRYYVICEDNVNSWNSKSSRDRLCKVLSLANRKHEHLESVRGDIPIVFSGKAGAYHTMCKAKDVNDLGRGLIERWTVDYKKILTQQNEYDMAKNKSR